ncbi:MAG: lytic transglycosylase F, partial [Bacteroides uniformis]|nr:lytic transglycosylase F [Bacteroides uniformis]
DHYLLLKSSEEYYQDPVCKNGYFRGIETYNFVRSVLERAALYRKKIKG